MILKDINPTSLDGNSVYDYNLHLPLPTKTYIQQETGIDLTLATGNEEQADMTIRLFAKTAMAVIKANIPSQAKLNIEYLIAKSEKHREAFCNVVAYMILSARGKGLDTLLDGGEGTLDAISRMARLQAEANDLLIHKYDFIVDEVRGDY